MNNNNNTDAATTTATITTTVTTTATTTTITTDFNMYDCPENKLSYYIKFTYSYILIIL